jgi:tetratricopeptide (TPR) repeat protein
MSRKVAPLLAAMVVLGGARATAEEAAAPTPAEPAAEAPAEAAPAEAPAAEEAPPSGADANVAEARERVVRGEELFEQGNFDAALVEFQQAYDIIGDHPNRYLVLYNIGQCHQRSFRYDQALRFYRMYLEEGGEDAEGRERVEESIAELEGLLATLVVEVNVPHAEVWVEDRQVGTAPGRVRIPGGLHVIEVRAEGHLAARQEVRVPAGGETELRITLEPLPERFEGLHQAYFWSAAALTVAAGITAAGLGIAAFQAHNETSQRLSDSSDRWNVTQGEIDRIGTLALAADVFFGVTAVFAVATVVFGLLTNWDGTTEDEETTASGFSLGLIASGDQGGLFAIGRF